MKLVIIDRDGVINEETTNKRVLSIEAFIPIDSSLDAIAKLKQTGHTVVIATNQSIISKGMATIDDLNKIHDYLQNLLIQKFNIQVDLILYCPHQIKEGCNCRKPKPGMLLEIAQKYQINFSNTLIPFVGDSVSDVLAASAVGVMPILVKTGKGNRSVIDPIVKNISNLLIFNNLNEFVDHWIRIN